MINFVHATFVKSSPNVEEAPKGQFPEVLFVGRSNVGKSSLINSLCSKKSLAYTSAKPGHTRLLNYYNIDDKFYLVDAPGYGFASGGFDLDLLFKNMMDDYFANAHHLKLVLFILDARRMVREDDVNLINYFIEKNIPFQIIFNKVDKVNQKEKAELIKNIKSVGIQEEEILFTSILMPKLNDKLKKAIENHIQ